MLFHNCCVTRFNLISKKFKLFEIEFKLFNQFNGN